MKYLIDLDDTIIYSTDLNNDAYNYALRKYHLKTLEKNGRITREDIKPTLIKSRIIRTKQSYFCERWMPYRMGKIMDDALMEELTDRLCALQLTEYTAIPQLKEQLKKVESGIENMLNAIQQGIILESTKKRLSDLEEQKKALELELIQEQIKKPFLTKEQILYGITRFRTLDLNTQEGKQRLIDAFVNAIYLYDDYALITCNYKDGTLRIPLEEIEGSDLLSFGVRTGMKV